MKNTNIEFYVTEMNTICAWINNMLDLDELHDIDTAISMVSAFKVELMFDFETFDIPANDSKTYSWLLDRISDYRLHLHEKYNDIFFE